MVVCDSKGLLFVVFLLIVGVVVGGSPRFAHAEEGFYAGLNGGRNWGFGGNSSTNRAGGLFNASLTEIDTKDGMVAGGAIGYRFSDLWRADVSYTYLRNNLDWTGVFAAGANPSTFTADTVSQLVLFNVYLHGKGADAKKFDTFDPFIGAGIGFVRNDMNNVVETFFANGGTAFPDEGSDTHPAIRLGIGLDTKIAPALTLTTAFDVYWLGEFQTDETRLTGASRGAIGAWTMDDVFSLGVTLGLRYTF